MIGGVLIDGSFPWSNPQKVVGGFSPLLNPTLLKMFLKFFYLLKICKHISIFFSQIQNIAMAWHKFVVQQSSEEVIGVTLHHSEGCDLKHSALSPLVKNLALHQWV